MRTRRLGVIVKVIAAVVVSRTSLVRHCRLKRHLSIQGDAKILDSISGELDTAWDTINDQLNTDGLLNLPRRVRPIGFHVVDVQF